MKGYKELEIQQLSNITARFRWTEFYWDVLRPGCLVTYGRPGSLAVGFKRPPLVLMSERSFQECRPNGNRVSCEAMCLESRERGPP